MVSQYRITKFLNNITTRFPALKRAADSAYTQILWAGDDYEEVVTIEIKNLVKLAREQNKQKHAAEAESLSNTLKALGQAERDFQNSLTIGERISQARA